MNKQALLKAYTQLKTIREFEERLNIEIATGEIAGFTHLYSGQEAVAVGVCEHLSDQDYIISTHRGHGHCIAKGGSVIDMMKEIYLQVPSIFVIENNGYGEHTGADYAVGGDLVKRTEGFGMPVFTADGADFFSVFAATEKAIAHAHAGNGPSAIYADCPRYFGHFVGDPQNYRTKKELEDIRENQDCVKKFRATVLADGSVSENDLDAEDAKVMTLIDKAVTEARAAPRPALSDILDDVYINY